MRTITSRSILAAVISFLSLCACGGSEQGACSDPNATGADCGASNKSAFLISGYRVVWQNGSQASIWKMKANADLDYYKVYDAGPGWTPVSYSYGQELWKHTTGKISLWTFNSYGDVLSQYEYGPYPGWSVINSSRSNVLWKDEANNVSFWTLGNNGGNPTVKGFPSNGYVPKWYEGEDRVIFWTDTTGQQARLTYLNYNADVGISFEKVYGPYDGWTPVNFDNRTLLWKNTQGQASVWHMDFDGNLLSYTLFDPPAGFTPAKYFEHEILWKDASGQVAKLWNMDSTNSTMLSEKTYGVYPGWSPIDMSY